MRRLVLLVTLAGVACLGLGAAMVLAGSKQNGTPSTDEILICHAGVGTFHEKWVEETPDASGIIGPSGHENHPHDIIPPFDYVVGTTTDHYDGLNYDTTNDGTVYTGGFTGADVLANNCVLPTAGGADVATVTVTVLQPTTVEVTVPGTPVPVPPTTITAPVTVTLSIPAVTTTTPGTTAVVTAAGSTTTVTLPAQTVTVPASAKTHTVVVTVTGPSHQIFLPPHAVKEIVTAKHLVRTIFKTVVRACKGGVAGAETSVTGQGKG